MLTERLCAFKGGGGKWCAGECNYCGSSNRGSRGPRTMVERFGAELVCVRFWYDPVTDTELQTAEIVEHEGEWRCPASGGGESR
jgi:hypothetical protein